MAKHFRLLMKFILTLWVMLLAIGFGSVVAAENGLPDEIVSAFASAKKVTLFSLEPEIDRPFDAPRPKPDEGHHGFKILGSMELAEGAPRTAAIEAIKKAVASFDGAMARCFEPRHSLRVLTEKGITYDLVVCFQCDQLRIYKGDKNIGGAGLTGSSKVLDELLAKANVPLSKKAM